MQLPEERRGVFADESAASFEFTRDIETPPPLGADGSRARDAFIAETRGKSV
jgi:hypothetical protein